MFTNLRVPQFQPSGDWVKDGPLLHKWIQDYFLSLENPGALSIIEEMGSWTPTLTFATPGDLSVAYTSREGWYVRSGGLVWLNFFIVTSGFTHTTASGALRVTGSPFNASASFTSGSGGGQWAGITKANYTQIGPQINSSGVISFTASGSGQASSSVVAADMPTGGTVRLFFTLPLIPA